MLLLLCLGTLLALPRLVPGTQGQSATDTQDQRDNLLMTSERSLGGRSFSPRKDKDDTISLWGGRIILSMETKKPPQSKLKETNRKLKLCISSENEIGVCTRLSFCSNFKITQLHNNICFMDVFIPGVCCVENSESPADVGSSVSSNTASSDSASTSITEKFFKPADNRIEIEVDAPECGVATSNFSSRIVQGTAPPAGTWPWMAAIYTVTILGRIFHCGGSLVSSTHVLTGTHCLKDRLRRTFSPKQIQVRLGDNDVSTTNDYDRDEPGRFYEVKEVIPHPKFRNINHYFMNDVAILKLKRTIKFTDTISPVCLPSLSAVSEPLDKFEGRYATVIGFGKTETGKASGKLLEARVPIWNNRKCDASYFAPITDIFICAGYEEGGIDACQGDSGGPLLILENRRWLQVGITSFGKGCGEAGYPGVYARVGKFTPWIREHMR